MSKKLVSFFTAALLAFSVSAFAAVSAAETYSCTPSAESTEGAWAVGANIAITPTSGSGFKLNSKDGTVTNSYVTWTIPISQLKKTPYFVINVKNAGSATEGPYMRLIYYLNNVQDKIVNPDFRDPNLENWVRANSKTGLHCFNVLEQLPEGTKDDAVFQLSIYYDPWETDTPLEISELYFSAEEVSTAPPAESSTPSSAPAQASSAAASPAEGSEVSSAPAASSALVSSPAEGSGSTSDEQGPASYAIPIVIAVIAVVIVAGVVVWIVLKKKKDKQQ